MNDRPVVLVTGGAGNLGRSVCESLLDTGARVAVPLYKTDAKDSLDALAREHPDSLFTFALDLTTERGADEAVRQTREWAGRLDAVAHLVGAWFGGMPLAETPVEGWDRMMDLNLKSSFLVARAAIPALLEQGGGPLVFIGSRGARESKRGHAAYAVAKTGVCVLAEAIAEEYGGRGIRAHAVLPGTIDTEANRRAMPDADRSGWTPPKRIAELVRALVLQQREEPNGAAVPV